MTGINSSSEIPCNLSGDFISDLESREGFPEEPPVACEFFSLDVPAFVVPLLAFHVNVVPFVGASDGIRADPLAKRCRGIDVVVICKGVEIVELIVERAFAVVRGCAAEMGFDSLLDLLEAERVSHFGYFCPSPENVKSVQSQGRVALVTEILF